MLIHAQTRTCPFAIYRSMNGIDKHTAPSDDTDNLGVSPSQHHVAASHRSMEPVHSLDLESRTLAPVRPIQMAESFALIELDHHLSSLTAHNSSIAEVGPP
jgi:hypothetical protein